MTTRWLNFVVLAAAVTYAAGQTPAPALAPSNFAAPPAPSSSPAPTGYGGSTAGDLFSSFAPTLAPPPRPTSTSGLGSPVLFVPAPTATGLKFTPKTRFFDPAITFQQCNDDSITLTAAAGTFAIGDVIVGILNGYQPGVLDSCTLIARSISSLSQLNGSASLRTQPASFSDIFLEVDFQSANVTAPMQAGGRGGQRHLLQAPTLQVGTDQDNFQLSVSGFSLDPIFDWTVNPSIQFRYANFAFQQLAIGLAGQITLGLHGTLDGSASAQFGDVLIGPYTQRFQGLPFSVFGVPFLLTPFASAKLVLSLTVQTQDSFDALYQATANAALSVSYAPSTGFVSSTAQFDLVPQSSFKAQLASCSYQVSATPSVSAGVDIGIFAPNLLGVKLGTTIISPQVTVAEPATVAATSDCGGKCGCQPPSIQISSTVQVVPSFDIQGGDLFKQLMASFPLPGLPEVPLGSTSCFPDGLQANSKCCSPPACKSNSPPPPSPPPSPPQSPQPSPTNPLAACGVGGNTSSLSPSATCPPLNGCSDPSDASAFHGSSCNDFCADLIIGNPAVGGCCVLSYSCDAGPCAPAACCGFQECIDLLPVNDGSG